MKCKNCNQIVFLPADYGNRIIIKKNNKSIDSISRFDFEDWVLSFNDTSGPKDYKLYNSFRRSTTPSLPSSSQSFCPSQSAFL